MTTPSRATHYRRAGDDRRTPCADMALTSGAYQIGPDRGRLLLSTRRQGVAARVGHDLTIEVKRWSGTVVVNTADLDRCEVRVNVEVDSLDVCEGRGGLKPLTEQDRADIHRTITDKILDASRFPTITFTSTGVTLGDGEGTVTGTLAVRDVERPLDIAFTVDVGSGAEATTVSAHTTIIQSAWGVRPYSGFFGALKLRDEVDVMVSLRLEAGG